MIFETDEIAEMMLCRTCCVNLEANFMNKKEKISLVLGIVFVGVSLFFGLHSIDEYIGDTKWGAVALSTVFGFGGMLLINQCVKGVNA